MQAHLSVNFNRLLKKAGLRSGIPGHSAQDRVLIMKAMGNSSGTVPIAFSFWNYGYRCLYNNWRKSMDLHELRNILIQVVVCDY